MVDHSKLTLSFSQIWTYLKCRYRWHLEYKRKIRQYFVVPPMDLGQVGHQAIAAAWSRYARVISQRKRWNFNEGMRAAKTAMDKWYREWKKERGQFLDAGNLKKLDDIRQNVEIVVRNALQEFNIPSWKVVWLKRRPLIERELRMPIQGWEAFRTFPDLVADDKEYGGRWVVDWKLRESFQKPEAEEVNLQFATMQRVLGHNLVKTVGSIMYQIRSRPPSKPKLNKDGSMSRARIGTTWNTYQKELIKHKLDPGDYEEMREKLDVPFYMLQRHYRGIDEIRNIWRDIVIPVSREMRRHTRIIKPIRTMDSMNCNGCWARRFCLAELKGDDIEFLLQTLYIDSANPRDRISLDAMELEVS